MTDDNADRPYKDCTFLAWVDKDFAKRMAPHCREHDRMYRNHEGLWAADSKMISEMWKDTPWRAAVYGPLLLAGGWFLYYDLDKRLGL